MDLDSTQKYESSSFEKTCGDCGCKFSVEVSVAEGQKDEEQYNCPKCAKAFMTPAAMPPEVTPLSDCGS